MVARVAIVVVCCYLIFGCAHQKLRFARHPLKSQEPVIVAAPAPYQHFVAPNFDWHSVRRIVMLPPANQTIYTQVAAEIRTNLAAEFQRAGQFDVIAAVEEDELVRAADVFASGQFNELEMLRVARSHQADAVMLVNVTQYEAYSPPRVGLSVLVIYPAESIAIAYVNGLWDAREANTAAHAQTYFKQTQNWPRSLMGADRIFDSPNVFQRYVCQQVAASINPAPGQNANAFPAMGIPGQGVMPASSVMPPGGTMIPMGTQMYLQPGMEPSMQQGMPSNMQPGAQPMMQPGTQPGTQPGFQPGMQQGTPQYVQPGTQQSWTMPGTTAVPEGYDIPPSPPPYNKFP